MTNIIEVEVAYAEPLKQKIITVSVTKKTKLEDIVRLSNISEIFKKIDLNNLELGIFGKKKTNDSFAKEFDRIEIYRDLSIDPKKSRINKARKAK